MTTIDVDRDRCEGHGLCEATAPEVYRLDDDGVVELVVDHIAPELLAKSEAGARICPVAALRVHE